MSGNPNGSLHEAEDEEPASEYANMREKEFERFLTMAIDGYADIMETPAKIRAYSDAGVLTNNNGLVVEIGDATFQVTIVRSR